MKITTNNVPRPLVCGSEVPAAIMESDFDYLPEDERCDERFFCYRGSWYDAYEFVRIQLRGAAGWNPMCQTAEPDSPLAPWHAIQHNSYFSAVMIRLVDDGDSVVVGRAYS